MIQSSLSRDPHLAGTRRRSALVWRSFIRNRGAVAGTIVLLLWGATALFAPRVAAYDPLSLSGIGRQPPSAAHPMGTDLLGRDVLSRVLFGARISLAVGVISVAIGVTSGSVIGVVAGYHGGRADGVLMRIIDAMLAFPGLLLALMVIAALGPGLTNVMLAVGVSSIPLYARLVRGLCLGIRQIEYIQAAHAMGGSDARIMLRHVAPNILGPVVVLATLQVGNAILVGSALSYLGMGAQPPTPEWGLMTSEGQAYLAGAWWMSTFPGLAILSAALAINLMGDGLRAALDPRSTYR